MKSINKGLRVKRFKIKKPDTIHLVVIMENGHRYTLSVENASLFGLGCSIRTTEEWLEENFLPGAIIPEAKIVWERLDIPLDRLVVRYIHIKSNVRYFGFSCVDVKIPLLGDLGRAFVYTTNDTENDPLSFELTAAHHHIASFLELDYAHFDIFFKCRQYRFVHESYHKKAPIRHYLSKIKESGTKVILSHQMDYDEKEVVSFASDDFLGLSQEKELAELIRTNLLKGPLLNGGSPLFAGRSVAFEDLETTLAHILRKEDSLVYSYEFLALFDIIHSIAGPNDLVLADIHASFPLKNALAASKAKSRFFKHNSLKYAENILERQRSQYAGCLLVLESFFPLIGDIAPLAKFIELGEKYECRIVVCEGYAFGLYGTGIGLSKDQKIIHRVDLILGSLNLTGLNGGFVAGSKDVLNWLRFFGHGLSSTPDIGAFYIQTLLKALGLMRSDEKRRKKLQNNIQIFRQYLKELDLFTLSDENSPIQSVLIKLNQPLEILNRELLKQGLWVPIVTFPWVEHNQARLLFHIRVQHSTEDLLKVQQALTRCQTFFVRHLQADGKSL